MYSRRMKFGLAVLVVLVFLLIGMCFRDYSNNLDGLDTSQNETTENKIAESETEKSIQETDLDDSGDNVADKGQVATEEKSETIPAEFEIPEKTVLQSSDKPVTIDTDGVPDIGKIKDYEESSKRDDEISEDRIEVSSIGNYSGPYVEDGSDEDVSDILSIVVTNVSKQFLQYSEITLKNGDQTATFALSNLPPGASALVLEAKRTPAAGEWVFEKDVTAFIDKADTCKELFSWEAGNHFFTLKNKSSSDYSNVAVYYKNTENGMYIGGITYRIQMDNLKSGETREKLSRHFDGNNSQVMMIDYIK